MRTLIFVTFLTVAVVARPEVGYASGGLLHSQQGLQQHGSSYNLQPHQQLPHEHNYASFAGPAMTYGAPAASGLHSGGQLAPPIVPAEPAHAMMAMPQQQDSYTMAYHLSSLPHASGYASAPLPASIHKHIYVHVPPKDFEDEDAIQPRVHHQVGPKQKHYKIVFIKAPAAPAIRPPIVAPPPQNEEKTLIYVLHKRPDTEQDIIIPTAAPTQPSKPEVYFIKYKTKKEGAPVYGPPPAATELEPRNVAAPSSAYGTPMAEGFLPMEMIDMTTMQPLQEEPSQQLMNEVPAATYGALPTMPTLLMAEAAEMAPPSNQYLAPEPTPAANVVAEQQQQQQQQQQVPATNYGPPTRFFIKKKK